MISPGAVIGGAAVGAGLVLAASGLLPGRPDIQSVLDRLDARSPSGQIRQEPAVSATALERAGAAVLQAVGARTVRVPVGDLELLGRSPTGHLGRKAVLALLGLLMPAVAASAATAAGFSLPFTVPAVMSLVVAAALWFAPDLEVRQQAVQAREDFRFAVRAFIRLVALERAADAAPTQALNRAASVGRGWVFSRIQDALARAELDGISPWEALRGLASELGVPELGAPADILAIAGDQGAAVAETLNAQARSLSGALLAAAKARANRATEQMVMPVAVLVLITTAYIGYPALTRILAS